MVLRKEDGELTTRDQVTMNVLGHYFHEVFVKEEDKGVLMEEVKDSGWDDYSIDFSINAVTRTLLKLQTVSLLVQTGFIHCFSRNVLSL